MTGPCIVSMSWLSVAAFVVLFAFALVGAATVSLMIAERFDKR